MLERLTSDKHSNLLGQFLGYEENEVLWIWFQVSYSEQYIIFVSYECTQ